MDPRTFVAHKTPHPFGPVEQILSPFRVLPDFLIIGTQKGGTNSLYRYLRDHPAVLPARKGIHYFNRRMHLGLSWYRAHFPLRVSAWHCRHKHGACSTGEGTANYLFHPLAAERAARTVPHARIIALLRDPAVRAYSHYQHNARRGRETLSFREALDAEPARTAPELAQLTANPAYVATNLEHFAYRAGGYYAEQLDRWYQHFSARQILVLRSEDLFSKPEEVYLQTTRFLNLPDAPLPEFEAHNSGGGYAGLDPAVENELRTHYRPWNERLARLLRTSEPWWP